MPDAATAVHLTNVTGDRRKSISHQAKNTSPWNGTTLCAAQKGGPQAALFPNGIHPQNPMPSLRCGDRSVLEVVLQDAGCKLGAYIRVGRFDSTDDLAAADNFSLGQSGDFRRQHEIDFQLNAGGEELIGLEEHSRTADVCGGADVPLLLAEAKIPQRQLKLESFRARRRCLLRA